MAVVPCKISRNTPGAILQPQPPPCESDVKRGEVSVVGFVIGRHYKRGTHGPTQLKTHSTRAWRRKLIKLPHKTKSMARARNTAVTSVS